MTQRPKAANGPYQPKKPRNIPRCLGKSVKSMNEKDLLLDGEWRRARVKLWATQMRHSVQDVLNKKPIAGASSARMETLLKGSRQALRHTLFKNIKQGTSIEEVAITYKEMDRLIDAVDNPAHGWKRLENTPGMFITDERINTVQTMIPWARQLWDIGPGFPLWAVLGVDPSVQGLWLPIVQRAILDHKWASVVASIIENDADDVNSKPVRLQIGKTKTSSAPPTRRFQLADPVYANLQMIASALKSMSADGWLKLALACKPAEPSTRTKEDRVAEMEHLMRCQPLVTRQFSFDQPFYPGTGPLSAFELTILGALLTITHGDERGELYRWNGNGADEALMREFYMGVWPNLYFAAKQYGLGDEMIEWREMLARAFLERNPETHLYTALEREFQAFDAFLDSEHG